MPFHASAVSALMLGLGSTMGMGDGLFGNICFRKEVHFQAGVKDPGIASVGYLVARAYQKKGCAAEGLKAVFGYLRNELHIRDVKAWSDTRNLASHQLAKKLGMENVEFIKDADFFKGEKSDEYVFAKKL